MAGLARPSSTSTSRLCSLLPGTMAAPRLAAGQQLVVALQHQLAFRVLRVVAAGAVLLEDRRDVRVVVGGVPRAVRRRTMQERGR